MSVKLLPLSLVVFGFIYATAFFGIYISPLTTKNRLDALIASVVFAVMLLIGAIWLTSL